jgi:hypothetical protein
MNQNITSLINRLDARITRWMARYGILLLRISQGIYPYKLGVNQCGIGNHSTVRAGNVVPDPAKEE